VTTKKAVFIFPGQGSQSVGMGKQLLTEFPHLGKYFTKSSEILGYDLEKLCFSGPEEKLNDTLYTQPAIFTVSFIYNKILKENGIKPEATAGHSLGEYSALCSAGVFSFVDGLKLVKKRAELMSQAIPAGRGSMAAIIGMDIAVIEDICNDTTGIVEIANINCPGQIIISGETEAIKSAMEMASQQGAKKVIELKVSGPFHSSLMEDIKSNFAEVINKVTFQDPQIPVIANVTADNLQGTENIKNELLQQLTARVDWQGSMQNLINKGHLLFVEAGPGRVLKGLMRRIDRSAKVYNIKQKKDISGIN